MLCDDESGCSKLLNFRDNFACIQNLNYRSIIHNQLQILEKYPDLKINHFNKYNTSTIYHELLHFHNFSVLTFILKTATLYCNWMSNGRKIALRTNSLPRFTYIIILPCHFVKIIWSTQNIVTILPKIVQNCRLFLIQGNFHKQRS